MNIIHTSKATSKLHGWLECSRNDPLKLNSWQQGDVQALKDEDPHQGYYSVCLQEDIKSPNKNLENWLHSPPIDVLGMHHVTLTMQFWMRGCPQNSSICRETFKVYVCQLSLGSTADECQRCGDIFDYHLQDTIAAERTFRRPNEEEMKPNEEVLNIPLKDDTRSLHIALVNEGACITLLSYQVYYTVCPPITSQLARFGETHSPAEATQHKMVIGSCVDHANTSFTPPTHHCTTSGDWSILTRGCTCNAGFYPNQDHTECLPCIRNTYKHKRGNSPCSPCPSGSYTDDVASLRCICAPGKNSTSTSVHFVPDERCTSCVALPSPPTNLSVSPVKNSKGNEKMEWNEIIMDFT